MAATRTRSIGASFIDLETALVADGPIRHRATAGCGQSVEIRILTILTVIQLCAGSIRTRSEINVAHFLTKKPNAARCRTFLYESDDNHRWPVTRIGL